MNDLNKQWYTLNVLIEAAAREPIEYGLMEAGALGTETKEDGNTISVCGYFDRRPQMGAVTSELLKALIIYNLPPTTLKDLQASELADRDWLAEWKKNWQPVQVGRFIIAPPWLVSEPGAVATGSSDSIGLLDPVASNTPRGLPAGGPRSAPGTDTIVIRINPGMAFGTGTHETTRLCLKAIEKHYRGGSFLDVGTGTGILAIAAARMCQQPDRGRPPLIIACDTDADAIRIAEENAEMNGVVERIDFRVGSVDDQTQSADLVCANLTAPVIVKLLPALIGATCGRLILSGILDSQITMVKSRLLELGVVNADIDQDGEWVALMI